MRLATWNINGIKARLHNVLAWLEKDSPDFACLQEIKSEDDSFPRLEIEALGYHVETHGQKGFNGVALLSKTPIEDVTRGLPGDDSDTQARYIEGVVSTGTGAVRLGGLYLPNGNPVDTEKYPYKLAWMARLEAHAAERLKLEEPFVLAGDYNVIPTETDVHDPEAWRDDALFRPETRAAFWGLMGLGFTDAITATAPEPHAYTFWDFQGGAWPKNHGIRIDHLLLSPEAADRLSAAGISKELRSWEKPSDHVPVWVDLDV